MIRGWLFVLTLVSALGCGVMAGVFFAFSAFIMNALARLPPKQGIAAMQSINVAVINAWFLAVFLGTALTCVLLVVSSLFIWNTPGAAHLLVGSSSYLVGTLMVTFTCNIPRNDALAAVDPASAEAERIWADYLTSWTAWNHVRTSAALVASAMLTIALCQRAATQL